MQINEDLLNLIKKLKFLYNIKDLLKNLIFFIHI